jgi:protein TonB
MNENKDFYTQYHQEETGKKLISRKLKKRILISVIVFHVVFIILPFIIYLLISWLKPNKPKTIKVTLVNPPPPGSPAPPPPPDVKPTNKPKPTPEPPKPPKPQKKKKKKKVVKKPVQKKEPVKKKPVQKKPDKPKWKPLDVSKIKISKKEIKSKTPSKPVQKFDVNKFAQRLKNLQSTIKLSDTAEPLNRNDMQYYETVSGYVYRVWKQPSESELGGRKPSVTIHVSVAANGSVLSASIVKRSGISAMDMSVKRLISELKNLPIPPRGAMQFDIILEVE